MSATLYVGNLPWSATEEQLTQFFSEYANVKSSRIITHRETGRSRGFGFVEVEDDEVERIISEVNGKEMNGRELVVSIAKPRM